MRTPTLILLLFLSFSIDVTVTPAADFTRFRGADATGVAKDHPKLPDRWSKTDNVAWVVDVPGQGWGSPIVVGDRVFVSSVVADEENTKPKAGLYLGQGVRDPAKGIHHWMVYCFDLKGGEELWRHEAHTGRPVVPRHPKSSYAAETPTTDGERLFVLFGDLGLYCCSLDGDFIEWYQPQASPYNTTQIVYGDYQYTVYDQGFMTCYNALTGEEVYGKRRFSPKGSFTSSPWAFNGKVFCLSEDGLTYVIKAGPEFEILDTNPLDELCIATPSVVDGKLLVRTLTKVSCITQGKTTAATDPEKESAVDESTIVQTRFGPVSGTESRDDSIEVFKGIPYAAPPVGDLRWRPPQPAAKWSDVRECNQFASKAMQTGKMSPGTPSEDCLYLNVWTARERSVEQRPVMVWIHGGGFTQGSGHQPGYDGTQLAKRGVVAVTINYRLGAFGFMAHPALSDESPHGSSGNYAILDQIAALKWVRDNVENFGGDPNHVTIFGESAGGTSVYLLTATPLSKGLFHRAILQSPWLDPVIFRDLKEENENGPPAEFDEEGQARKLLSEHAETEDVLAKLRAISANDVLEKMKQRWPVATDGWVFPKDPHQIYSDGDQHDIPVIVGTNRDEGTMFAPRKAFGGTLETYRQAMVERFGEDGEQVAEFYAPESKDDLWKVAVQQISDTWFIQPARQCARSMDRQGTDVWMYHFTKPVWGWMGAAHAAEIGYVFGNLEEPKPDDAALSDSFMDYWVQFAKTGNPNVNGKPVWPRFTVSEDRHLVMDKKLAVGSKLRSDACDLLDKHLNRRRQPIAQNIE